MVSLAYHACGDGVVGGFVYQDERAEGMVFFVGRGGDRLLGFEADATDVVEFERVGGFDAAEGVHVPNVGNRADFDGRGLGGVFQQVFAAQVERDVVEPAQRGLELLFGRDGAVGGGNAVAARDVEVGVERDGQHFARFGGFGFAVWIVNFGDFGGMSARQDFDFVAGFQTTCLQPALIAAEVVAAAAVLPCDALHGEMGGLVGGVLAVDGQAFEQG